MNGIIDTYAPVTWHVGLVNACAKAAVEALAEWRREIGNEVKVTAGVGGIGAAVATLAPFAVGSQPREVVIDNNDSWSAIFVSAALLPDVQGAVRALAQRLSVTGLLISMREESLLGYGDVRFTRYEPETSAVADIARSARSVQLHQDGARWKFVESGSPLSFEEIAAYNQRRPRNRLTKEMILRYCNALGVAPDDENANASQFASISSSRPDQVENVRFASLDAMRIVYGLEGGEQAGVRG